MLRSVASPDALQWALRAGQRRRISDMPKQPSESSDPEVDSPYPGIGWREPGHELSSVKKLKGLRGSSAAGLGFLATDAAHAQRIQRELQENAPYLTDSMRKWLRTKGPRSLWECVKCHSFTPKTMPACDSCGHHRPGTEDPNMPRWICSGCLFPNKMNPEFTHCRNCSAPRTRALPGVMTRNAWICQPCKTVNHTETCVSCSKTRLGVNEFDPYSRDGGWYCSECKIFNFKGNKKCRACGFWK
ncbi:hypothetical protein DIPPA_30040 [Diplonema papillatum]|nr:hypothetical protein DIPPA_30040 [Diplonema papillatum]KAJ9468137.1 hypothetical protein DIPPA_30040 [Diplonema papillatum]